MIKRTICFSNPAYLSMRNEQMVIKLPVLENADVPAKLKEEGTRTIPIEDIGLVMIDNKQITITSGLIEKLVENNCVIITCDSNHMPTGILQSLSGNSVQNERYRTQLEASLPLKKQLWQQTVQQKIKNQATLLHKLNKTEIGNMTAWSNRVKSGDTENLEGRAAAYYWKKFFPSIKNFVRDRDGIEPNNLLNYGYAVLRAIVARALISSGLMLTMGIHHQNKYNAYCLADDIMEPYRPYIDEKVHELYSKGITELNTEVKTIFLQMPTYDVYINNKNCTLQHAVTLTTASLYRCYSGETRKILYPEML